MCYKSSLYDVNSQWDTQIHYQFWIKVFKSVSLKGYIMHI